MATPNLSFESAQDYWDFAADSYDLDFTATLIGMTRRAAIWKALDRAFQPGQKVLELNCGTGIDAVHLANRGVRVLACDISPRMIEIARQYAKTKNAAGRTEFRVLRTECIGVLRGEGLFDGAFSTFAGLNCVEDLAGVARSLAEVLKPGAPVLASMMGRFVPWEIAWFLAHGAPKKAVRRLHSNRLGLSHGPVIVRTPSIKEISATFEPSFVRRAWKGIGIGVAPTYMESWARRFPTVTKALARVDDKIGLFSPFRNMADCVLFEFEKRPRERG